MNYLLSNNTKLNIAYIRLSYENIADSFMKITCSFSSYNDFLFYTIYITK